MSAAVIVTAAGLGKRFGGRVHKAFVPLRGRPLVLWSLRACEASPAVSEVVLTVHPADVARAWALVRRHACRKVRAIVPGSSTRADSVHRGLQAVSPGISVVAVHDAARPLVTSEIIGRTIAAAAREGAALAAVPMVPTTKLVDRRGRVVTTLDRRQLWAAQTPQAFRRDLLEAAYRRAGRRARQATDESMLVEWQGIRSRVVEDTSRNLKVTTMEDLRIAEALVHGSTLARDRRAGIRVGFGFDLHRVVRGRRLILGGIPIPSRAGLLGHSDADVILHAIGSALLGAIGAGDLGQHFPDTDPRWKGVSSRVLLAQIRRMVVARGASVENVDVTVVAQAPRLEPFKLRIRASVAVLLGVVVDRVNVKATTYEGLGPIGQRRAIAAYAVAAVSGVRATAR